MLLLYRLKAPKPFRSSGHLCYSTKVCDPLRILFCGSEEYSIASLRALRDEQARQPESILSIDVVCRPPKRVSRGLRTIRDVPIKPIAQEMGLSVHEIDTFTGWAPPQPSGGLINLVVAVSFGLFVPPRILNAAKYGGLNLHPSLLPDFRGPAPLHHMLLAGETKTGVTMQTLHPLRFDHGIVLDQTPSPGFDIPDPGRCTVDQLRTIVAASSARMLVDGIRNKIFVPPLEEVGWHGREDDTTSLRHAPKITPEDKHIKWRRWTSVELSRRNRILGPLWNLTVSEEGPRRLLFPTVQLHCARRVEELDSNPGFPVGRLYYRSRRGSSETGPVLVNTVDQTTVEIPQIKIEGEQAKPAIDLFRSGNRKRFPLTTISDQNGTWHTLQVALT